MRVTIEVNGRSHRAKVPDSSTLARMLEDGDVPGVVSKAIYNGVYILSSGKWILRTVTKDLSKAQTLAAKHDGESVILTRNDPSLFPEKPQDIDEVEAEEADKTDEQLLEEWKSIDGVGKKSGQRAVEEIGPVSEATEEKLRKIKGFGDKNIGNVLDHGD